MPLKLHAGLQIAASLLAIGSAFTGYLPPTYAGILLIAINASKDILAVIAQHYNTNGTPQELPGGRAVANDDLLKSLNKRTPQA